MGMISSVVNMAATLPAYIIPFVGVYIRQKTGSWFGIFALAAAVQLGSAAVWWNCASLTTARELLKQRDDRKKGA